MWTSKLIFYLCQSHFPVFYFTSRFLTALALLGFDDVPPGSVLFSVSQIKPWSELSGLVRLYFCFTMASLLALLGLTISSIYKQHKHTDIFDEDNFTVSLILLIGIREYTEPSRSVM